MRSFFSFTITVAMIISQLLTGSFVKLLPLNRWTQIRILIRLVSFHSKYILWALKVELQQEGTVPEGSFLVVANHHSYLDALILSTIRPTAFVTSLEMKATPLLGWLTQVGGCLYVNRRSKEKIHSEINEIEEALNRGISVVIFPEATSTNGEKILPFKRPLFQSALKARTSVLPLVLQYHGIDGEKIGRHNRDLLCWYGDMTFGGHFMKLITLKKIEIKVKILNTIPIQEGETKESLAEKSFTSISQTYQPLI